MKHFRNKHGFTIIEVALFLALSGFLMVGIVIGANVSISRQRYNDSVNSFAEYIRGIYADVMNVSNDKNPDIGTEEAGRTKSAIYGKVISFGETDGDGNILDTIYVYDLVGQAVSSSSIKSARIIEMMYNSFNDGGVNANIFDRSECPNATNCTNKFYNPATADGLPATYEVPWMGSIGKSHANASETGNTDRFSGVILVIRSPVTGGIRTYTYSFAAGTHDFHRQRQDTSAAANFTNFMKEIASDANQGYGERELTICIDSDDNNYGNRRGVRIAARANNSSSVMLTEMDSADSLCRGRNN